MASPEFSLPKRSSTTRSSFTRRTSMSDDEAIPDTDSSETTNLLLERLRAWKHMCGYLEDYVSTTAKVAKSQSKDQEKILKTVSEPLKEGHHFSTSPGGVSGLFENIRSNTQGMMNMHLETEKNIKGQILPTLERLHKEIKNKSKELSAGAAKGAKAVEKARQATQKSIELLAQSSATHDAAIGSKIETAHDPYILKRGINHRLNKQVIEENNHRQDILVVQNSFQDFEAHVLETVRGAMDQFFQLMNANLDRERAKNDDILGTAQRIPADFEWVNFSMRNEASLVNPDGPLRSFSSITYPNQEHNSTKPLIEGSLERRSRALIKGYSTGYYVVTPAKYLHEFKGDDDFKKDPTPELSLYLPDCIVGAIDGVKFNVKGKDVSSGKVGNAFHTNTELSFKAHTPNDAEKWWTVIKDATRASTHTAPVAAAAAAPVAAAPVATSPTASAAVPASATPPTYSEKEKQVEGVVSTSPTATTPTVEKGATSPTVGVSRSASTASHFHTAPAGSAVE